MTKVFCKILTNSNQLLLVQDILYYRLQIRKKRNTVALSSPIKLKFMFFVAECISKGSQKL